MQDPKSPFGMEGRVNPAHEVLDDIREGLQVIDREYRYVYLNSAALEHARRPREALIGSPMKECYPGIDQSPMFAVLSRSMERREPAAMENLFTYPDGTQGWFELRFEPVPAGLAILSFDITSRKEAEERLLRAHRSLRTLSRCNQTTVRARDAVPLMAAICDLVVESGGYAAAAVVSPDHRGRARAVLACTPVDPSGQLFTGSTPTEVVERCAGEARPQILEVPEPMRGRTGIGAWTALPIRRRELQGVLLIGAVAGDRFDDEEMALLAEIALDLGHGLDTIRTRLELEESGARLEHARQMTRGLFDHLPNMAFVWRVSGGPPVLEDFNRRAQTAIEVDLHDLLGRRAVEIAPGIPSLEVDIGSCIATDEIVRREASGLLPGAAEPRRFALSYGPLPPDRVILHARDVTEQRQMEERLAATQRLEAVGRLAGGAAHDFNNLLSVILTYADFVAEELPVGSPALEDLQQIRHAAERAATLTRGLLAFSRKQILEARVMDLGEVLVRITPMLRGVLREDVVIHVRPGRSVGRVRVDVSQMEQVIMNLAVNAGDAMPNGGSLSFETANVELAAEHAGRHPSVVPGAYVVLTCTDTGAGMDEETLSHVFEPFFTTKPKDRGTGLGLAVVYGIVKQSGGHIWVESEPGRGTTFEIYLPRVDAEADAQTSSGRAGATGHETVLLVEDMSAVRAAAIRILSAAGFQVLSAGDGLEAIEVAERFEGHIDLLLTDVVLPHMSGKQLAERLVEARPGLRVLFTSGYAEGEIVHQGVLDEGTHFIPKPFLADDLTRRVREVLDEAARDA